MAILKSLIVNGVTRIIGDLTASKIIKQGGISSLFLKADGSVDSTSYYHSGNKPSLSDLGAASADHTHSYLPLSGGALIGNISVNSRYTFTGDPTGYDYGGLYRNSQITNGGDATTLWLYSYNAIKIYGSSVLINGEIPITSGNIGLQSVSYANSAGNADTVDNYNASNLTKFYLSPLESSAPASSAKSWFTDTMPSGAGAIVYNVPGSEKTIIVGKSTGSYGHMLQLNYDDTYLRILRYAGSWKSDDWEKISAGYADSAGNAETVDGEHSSAFAHIGAHNNLTASGNEFTFASSGFSGEICINYRTAGGTNGNITGYLLGNGAGGVLGTAIHSGNIGSLSVNYADSAGNATSASYYTLGPSAPYTNVWDCNEPDRIVYSDYGSSGRSVANAPSGWNYGTLLELGHMNYRGRNCPLNLQLIWDVAHNTSNGGTLWFRAKDEKLGWAKTWCKVLTDQNYGSYALPLSGGTVTGLVTFANNEISLNGVNLLYQSSALGVKTAHGSSYFGMMNSSHCHIYTDAPSFYMDKPLYIDSGKTVIHSGNIGSQSVNYANSAGSAPANGGTSDYAQYLIWYSASRSSYARKIPISLDDDTETTAVRFKAVYYDALTYRTDTNTISSNISGNAATATLASTVIVPTSSSTSPLKILFHIENNIYSNSNLKVTPSTGNVTSSGHFYANSDIRYKNIIEHHYSLSDKIAQLPIIKYKWTNRDDDSVRIGSSALSVMSIIPELVSYDDNTDFYSLDYATLGAVAGISACKEVEMLKLKVKELELEIIFLKSKYNG